MRTPASRLLAAPWLPQKPIIRVRHQLLALTLLLAPGAATAGDEAIPLTLINHFETAYLYGELRVGGVSIEDAALLARFYEQRRFEPLWMTGLDTRRRRLLRDAIAEATSHGLNPDRYHLAAIDSAEAEGRAGDAELLLGQAFLRHASHRALGVVDPAGVDPDWRLRQNALDKAALLEALGRGANPRRLLDRLWPKARGYRQLLEARRTLTAAAATAELPLVPAGPLLRPGMSDPRIPLIRQRLGLEGGTDTRYDAELALELRQLQRSIGLEPDARIGPNTLAVINRSQRDRLQQVDVNLERWRWLPDAFPARHVLVNIADYSLLALDRSGTALEMDVIVGRTYRQTPVFTETMKYLVFNPFWDVPTNIARKDQLPRLREDPGSLARQGFEAALAADGAMAPVDRFNWQEIGASTPFRLRQRPGPENALGRIKFMLPNEFAVYLHDTPARGLFDRTERSFSSGCIRVADAPALAEWALAPQRERWTRARIEAAMDSGKTQTVVFDEPLPVYIVYFTAYVDAAGTLRLMRDVYERDGRIAAALAAADA